MDDVKVSVFITFYNQCDNVDVAVSSVLNQETTFRFEVLIGDDGSDDGSWEKVQEWRKRYPDIIFIFRRNRDDGVMPGAFRASRNRLELLKHARGDYITFLDGDDAYIDNSKLQSQFDVLEQKDNSDCTICAHDLLYIYPDGKQQPKYGDRLPEGKYSAREYWNEWYFSTNTEMIRSSAIRDFDHDLLVNNYNDNVITFLGIQRGSIYYIPKLMASYVQTGKGLWTGEKKTTNLIRNVFVCDLANIINPGFRRETDIRFRYTWKELYKNRKMIIRDELIEYEKEAIDKELKYSKLWINYNELNIFSKIYLLCKLARIEIAYRHFRRSK